MLLPKKIKIISKLFFTSSSIQKIIHYYILNSLKSDGDTIVVDYATGVLGVRNMLLAYQRRVTVAERAPFSVF